ncbi:MAG: REP-associated tyrosine transposase [Telluria sp.]
MPEFDLPRPMGGGTFFFTVRLLDPASTLLTEHFPAFGEAMRHARAKKPFSVDAWCVLPDHVHAIWTLPAGDDDFAARWRAVKIGFSKGLRKATHQQHGLIWEPLFLHREIHSEQERAALVDYIHNNPVRHGMCLDPEDWLWSSIHRPPAPPVRSPKTRKGPQALPLSLGVKSPV